MASTIQATGYIVSDDMVIWGYGPTADTAWQDMLRGMREAGIEVVDEITEEEQLSPFNVGNKTLASRFRTRPATAALLRQVEEQGGNISWGDVDGVACTRDEEEPADLDAIFECVKEGLIDNSRVNHVSYAEGWTPDEALRIYYTDQAAHGTPTDAETDVLLQRIGAWLDEHKAQSWHDEVV